jgi:hypothetical protein
MDFVPELSRFFGIVIRMFSEPGAPYHVPHFPRLLPSRSRSFFDQPGASVITPKPARHDHFKTGQPTGIRTTFFVAQFDVRGQLFCGEFRLY